jgi:lactate dehydrogenase-like 2-hydroxyacid dehydrogenase
MKITILCPKSEFTEGQQKRLSRLGEIIYTKNRNEYPLEKLIELSKDSEILAFDPDNIGGFEVSAERLVKLIDAMPKIRGLALSTTAFGYVNKGYCQKRNITITNIPYYSTESVAEHTMSFLMGGAKRVFLTDRRTQKGKYRLEMGYELKGKTLGIVGLGHIGSRTAELGLAIGMKVIAWNRTPKQKEGIEMKSLDDVLAQSDAIAIHLAENETTRGILSKESISKLKKGVIVVNTASRSLVDEKAMADALKSGKVDTYILEAEDLDSPPLGGLEKAILFKGFGWFTKESLERNKEIWVSNIEGIAKGNPPNPLEKA